MFGGIVETTGIIRQISDVENIKQFIISPCMTFDDLALGDSIAVNGVCLTITNISNSEIHVTAVHETLSITNLGQLVLNQEVNLERALKANQRIGGHHVQGHVDGIAMISEIQPVGSDTINVSFAINNKWLKYIVYKGFITIDGMSITITNKTPESFSVTFIPYTIANTIVKHYRVGQHVNIEVDILGKYIEQYIGAYLNESKL